MPILHTNIGYQYCAKAELFYFISDFQLEPSTTPSSFTFKEYEIVIDTEVIPKAKSRKKQAEELQEYQKLVAEGKAGSLGEYT